MNYTDNYYFTVRTHPYIPIDKLHFCWSNDVRIVNKNEESDGRAIAKWIGGEAKIETDGDIGACLKSIAVFDTAGWRITDPITIQPFDSLGIKPSSAGYPPDGWDDAFDPEPYLPSGPNSAKMIMPEIEFDEIAKGCAYCDVSDDYGSNFRISFYMESKWSAVYSCSVSPNPAGERLEVRMTVEGDPAAVTADAPVTALLYSGTGLVAKETFADIRSGGSLDVSHLSEGTYYLNIEVNGTVVDRQVVLIQR